MNKRTKQYQKRLSQMSQDEQNQQLGIVLSFIGNMLSPKSHVTAKRRRRRVK